MEIIKRPQYLPDTIEELRDFILIGKEKLKAHQAKIRAIEKVEIGQKAREAALLDSQAAAEILIHAEAKLGELLKAIPKPKFDKQINGSLRGTTEVLPNGITKRLSHEAQTIANNLEKVEEIIAKAKEEKKIPTPNFVYKKLKTIEKTEEKIKKVREISKISTIKPIIKLGDFRKLIKEIQDNSIDLILTDPPYAKSFLPLWEDLAREAKRVLKPSKFFISYSGNAFLPDVLDILRKHLSYYWIGMLYHKGVAGRQFEVNMFNCAKPILFFYKPPLKKQDKWINDVIVSEEPEKTFHEWGQNIEPFKKIIECFTDESEVVLDPLFGGGSVLIAGMELGRKTIGFESEEKYYELARKNLLS